MKKNEIKQIIALEKKLYFANTKHYVKSFFLKESVYYRFKYLYHFRLETFYKKTNKILLALHRKKKNKLGLKLGFEIFGNQNIGKGLLLYHNGPIVINSLSTIGDFCKFHGCNCVGNDGKSDDCPIIGDNVDIGYGAIVIGKVKIANNCVIAAGAVVVNDVLEPNSLVAGVPARVIKIME